METLLIAGGSGLIGSALANYWKQKGYEVRILTRGNSNAAAGRFHWDPENGTMDEAALQGVTAIVNLSGAGIADKRWTAKRRRELFDSRVKSTECLWKFAQHSPTLHQYLSASGITCYGFEDDTKVYKETDPFGSDLLSQITQQWETAANLFAEKCTVTCLRISVVLSGDGGALKPIAAPIKKGFGTILGPGTQAIPWIHIDDLVAQFDFALEQKLAGSFNTNAGNTDNATLTRTIARLLGKPLWLPHVPSWALRLVLGQMADVVLLGSKADNGLLLSKGFQFNFPTLESALTEIYGTKKPSAQ